MSKDANPEAGPSASASTSPVDIPEITNLLDQLTADADALPRRSDLQFHRTLDRKFAKELDGASDSVLALTGQLVKLLQADQSSGWRADQGKVKGKGKAVEIKDEEGLTDNFRKTVGETIDALLEDAAAKIDEAVGANKEAAVAIDPRKAAAAAKKLPGPFADTAAGSSRLPSNITSARVSKPQDLFPDAVNNDPTYTWQPTLPFKAHAMVPLDHVNPMPKKPAEKKSDPTDAQRKAQDKAWDRYRRECRQRSHPYYFETEHLPYPTRMFEIAPPIEPRLKLDEQEAILVDTPETLAAMTEELKQAKEIAVDLEYHNTRSYYGFTCLMQISTRENDFIVDTLKLRGELREDKLGGVMADPSIVKVFHGSESDVLWLQQDFDIYLVNLFDTYHATHVLNHTSHALAGLLSRYAGFAADKRYQLADWRIRPLPKAMLQYAQSDTHFLLYIYDHLRNELLAMASRPPSPAPDAGIVGEDGEAKVETRQHTPETNPQRALRQVLQASADTALGLYQRDNYDPVTGKGSSGWRLGRKKQLPKAQYGQLEGLVFVRVHQWRDRLAREFDESPHWWLPNEYIRTIATSPLSSPPAISRILARLSWAREHIGAKDYGKEISNIVVAAKKEYATLTVKQKIALEATLEPEKERSNLAFLGRPSGEAVALAQQEKAAAASASASPFTSASTAKPTTSNGNLKAANSAAIVSSQGSDAFQASDDLWNSIASGPTSAPSANAPAPAAKQGTKKGSALFGKTIPSARSPASAAPSQASAVVKTHMATVKKSSALFGKALPAAAKGGDVADANGDTPAGAKATAKADAERQKISKKEKGDAAAKKAFQEAEASILSDVESGVLPFVTLTAAPSSTPAGADAAHHESPAAGTANGQIAAAGSGVRGRTGVDQLKIIISKGRAAGAPASPAPTEAGNPLSEVASPAPAESSNGDGAEAAEAASPASAPSAPKVKAKTDDIVQVKRKKVKHAPSAPTPASTAEFSLTSLVNTIDTVSQPASGLSASAPAAKPKAKKAKTKTSLSAQAAAQGQAGTGPDFNGTGQEMFDYSAQPDFLSASHQRHLVEGGKDREKADEEARKSKKAKKKAKANGPPTSMIETPDFGPRPRDMTQPKAGAKSHTFTS